VDPEDLGQGAQLILVAEALQMDPADCIATERWPSFRDVSASIATTVLEVAYGSGLANRARPDDLPAFIRSQMYEPAYRAYV
jgi:hypothetical protein